MVDIPSRPRNTIIPGCLVDAVVVCTRREACSIQGIDWQF